MPEPPPKPFVQAACLCENILTSQDGVISAIRMFDRVTVSIPPNLPEEIKPTVQLNVLVALKSNGHQGKYMIELVIHGPTKTHPPNSLEIEFKPEYAAGATIQVEFQFGIATFGQCSIDVNWYGDLLTKIPFTLVRAEAQSGARVG